MPLGLRHFYAAVSRGRGFVSRDRGRGLVRLIRGRSLVRGTDIGIEVFSLTDPESEV